MASSHAIFVYGSLLPGEIHHHVLAAARHLGAAQTLPRYRLVELGPFPALIDGSYAIRGELYLVDAEVRRQLDVLKEHPRLFFRSVVELEPGALELSLGPEAQEPIGPVEAYMMREDQVRGRRRLKVSDWRARFSRQPPSADWNRPRRLR